MKAIVIVDNKWGIGRNNDLLFSVPADMKFFRRTTLGKVVVMGGNTLRSFPGGRPLPSRTNVVLDSERELCEGCTIVHSLHELAEELKKYNSSDVFVIGGAMTYRTMLPYCSHVLVTKADADGGATVFFENLDEHPDWTCVQESDPEESNGYSIKFTTYENKNVKEFSMENIKCE